MPNFREHPMVCRRCPGALVLVVQEHYLDVSEQACQPLCWPIFHVLREP